MEPFEQVDCVLSGMFTGTTVDFVDTTFRDRWALTLYYSFVFNPCIRWIRYHNLLKLFSEKSPTYLAKIRKQIQAATGWLHALRLHQFLSILTIFLSGIQCMEASRSLQYLTTLTPWKMRLNKTRYFCTHFWHEHKLVSTSSSLPLPTWLETWWITLNLQQTRTWFSDRKLT